MSLIPAFIKSRHRLVLRLAFYLIGFGLTVATLFTAIELNSEYRRDLRDLDDRMHEIEQTYLASVADTLWVHDSVRLDALLQGMVSQPDFVRAEIRVDGRTQMRRGQPLGERPGISRTFQLRYQHRGESQLIGELVVEATHERIRAEMFDHLQFMAITNGIREFLVAIFVLFVFQRLIGRHLQYMADFFRQNAEGENRGELVLQRSEPAQADELSDLTQAFNQMHRELSALHTEQRERANQLERELAERLNMEKRQVLMASVFRNSREAILITDADNQIVACNDSFTKLTGYAEAEVVGQNPRILASGLTPQVLYRDMWAELTRSGIWQGELWDRRKDGSVYPKWISINVVRDPAGAVANYVAIFSDISQMKEAEEKIHRLSNYDALTGLRNRLMLSVELKRTLASASAEGQKVALLMLDLDHFKEINDLFGHASGDQVLVLAANRLTGVVREHDVVARLGGDEFVVVLRQVSGRDSVRQVADKIRQALDQPYTLAGKLVRAPSSIGIAVAPDDGATSEVLLKCADTAMYHAKAQGRNNVQFYEPGMEQAMRERVQLAGELRVALEQGQLALHYQPQTDARSGRLAGLEALVRWNHPEQGLVSPARFIPVAEQSGLIESVGTWVLDEACRQIKVWREQHGAELVPVAVNLSIRQLNSPTLVDLVARTLARHDLPGSCLELEITESMLMEDIDINIEKLNALRAMNVNIMIDDFGTGYSSLSYLRRLPINGLKLDRSFVQEIESDSGAAAICVSSIGLAHNLGLTVVAEGVETQAQRDFLARNDCDVLQGYLLGRPVPADKLPGVAQTCVIAAP